VGIVIEVIRKNNSDYDPDVGAEANSIPSSRDPIYLGTLLRMFAQHVPDFMELILSPNHTIGGGDGPVTIKRKELNAAFGAKIEPLGFDRFKTCELMAELLHCSNMGLLNEVGGEEFVKARDAERERLKSEGKLGILTNQSNFSNEDLTMKSPPQTRLGSPDSSRKLEVQNASDDDGFEEVTHAADLGDDAKDDFDEKAEDLTPPNSVAPLSFTEKDEEEFVDEPLSPRLATREPNHQPHPFEEPDMIVQPLSPTKDLSNQIDSLGLQSDKDTEMTSPPPSVDSHTEDSESSADGGSEKVTPASSEESTDSPPRLKAARPLENDLPDANPGGGSFDVYPEDAPAPLFAKKSEPSDGFAPPIMNEVPEVPELPGAPAGGDSLDTTMGEAGDSSVVMGNTEDTTQQSVTGNAPILPVVGDFLKMQFVEHKVVPTILVSTSVIGGALVNPCRISSSVFHGITSFIM
jgi:SIT4-associating protein SAP185/190